MKSFYDKDLLEISIYFLVMDEVTTPMGGIFIFWLIESDPDVDGIVIVAAGNRLDHGSGSPRPVWHKSQESIAWHCMQQPRVRAVALPLVAGGLWLRTMENAIVGFGSRQKQIPFGNDNKRQKQIPFGNDKKGEADSLRE